MKLLMLLRLWLQVVSHSAKCSTLRKYVVVMFVSVLLYLQFFFCLALNLAESGILAER